MSTSEAFPLKRGSNGADVILLQDKLRSRGFNPGPSDGDYGEATEAAVVNFQRSEGLLADGIVGPNTATALGLDGVEALPSVIPGVTVQIVRQMFPVTPAVNIEANLPMVLDALIAPLLTDKPMILMALSTIRAETESFRPVSEGQSKFNTSPDGHPFDLYDYRRDLGNLGPPDGDSFKGRGFIQLTGRANYAQHGAAIGLGSRLITNPGLANDPSIAAKLLASFLKAREVPIRQALLEGDLRHARRLVNGGINGLDRFTDAFKRGDALIPENPPASSSSSTAGTGSSAA